MEVYFSGVKDILLVITPFLIAYISYRSGKKTQKDIKLEVERVSKEKEAETKQLLDKIGAELESQKQLMTWQNSMPQTNEYLNLLDKKRSGHISSLSKLCQDIYPIMQSCPSAELVTELNQMLDRIELPKNDEELFPYEVPIMLKYKMMRKEIDEYLHSLSLNDNRQEDTTHAHP